MQVTDPRVQNAFRSSYPLEDGRYYCLETPGRIAVEKETRGGINAVKSFLKQWSGLYEFLQVFFGPGISVIPHLTPRAALRRAFAPHGLKDKLVLNIGSGVRNIGTEVINVDVYPFQGVHIIADAANLPFAEDTVDMIVCEDVLEHVTDPFGALSEFKRVIRPGGCVYIAVPFLYPFHASPSDFTRFTRNILREKLPGFTVLEEGVRAGPMSTLQAVLMHICAMLLSFGWYPLYFFLTNIFMVLFSPLKLLDVLFALFPYTHEAAADIYILARKN